MAEIKVVRAEPTYNLEVSAVELAVIRNALKVYSLAYAYEARADRARIALGGPRFLPFSGLLTKLTYEKVEEIGSLMDKVTTQGV